MSSETKTPKKLIGTCKWFNSKKGFGFITPSDGSQDVFVHQTSIHAEGFRSLGEGEQVEYNTQTDDNNKIKAVDVTGPGGAHVKGAPKPNYRRNYNNNYRGGGGGGGGRGRGLGGPRRNNYRSNNNQSNQNNNNSSQDA